MTDDIERTLQQYALDRIAFPVTVIDQSGARAVAEHEQFLRDGAELVNGGRKAYRGKSTAAFLNGLSGWPDLYPGRFTEIVTRLEGLGEMQMQHPLLGTFRVMVPTWDPKISTGVRNGAFLDFTWIEQRASSVGIVAVDRAPLDVVADLDSAAALADTSLGALGILTTLARGASAVRLAIGRALAPIGEVQGAISSMRRQIADATRLLSLQALTGTTRGLVHAGRAALAQCKGALARVEAQASDPVGLGRRITAPRKMTVGEFAVWVYRDVRRAGQLRAVNGLASDTIAEGATLVVP